MRYELTYRMGANVSSRTMGMSREARTIVGSTKWPGRSSRRPPHTICPPCDLIVSIAASMVATARSLMSGPINTSSSAGLPILTLP